MPTGPIGATAVLTLIEKIQLTKQITVNSPFFNFYGNLNFTVKIKITVKSFKCDRNLVA